MLTKTTVLRVALLALLVGMVTTIPALAGSAVIGSVAGSMNATVGGQSLLPNTTIFSGDSLQVRDGVAVIAVGNNSRVIFGRDTTASFLREINNDEVTVLLSQGGVSMLHPTDGTPVRVKVGDVSVTPSAGFKTLGEVAMLNGSLVVTAKEGALQVEGHGVNKNVSKGQTIVIAPKTAQKGGGGGAGWGGTSTVLEVMAVGAGVTAAILGGVAMSRAGSANTAANEAISAANAATSAANTANSTAAAAAAAASAAATSASNSQILAECITDLVYTGSFTSPYVLNPIQCGHLP